MSSTETTLPGTGPLGRGTDPSLSTKRGARSAPHGLFDFFLCALLLYGVYAKTPLGALGEWAVRALAGQEYQPSLFGTFRGRDAEVDLSFENLEKGVLASLSFPASIDEASKRTRVDPELLAVLVAVHGKCELEICTVKAPPQLGAVMERAVEAEEVPVLDVAVGLAKGAQRLDASHLAAVEALFLPPHAVERAISQARASGLDAPDDVEVHATFLPPSLRRGQLQQAVQVLALHRLRTLAWPTTPDKRITSPFGYRIHPVTGEHRFHNGADVGVRTGTPLMSAHQGTVGRVGQDSISGKYVKVSHGFGIESTYCHMSEQQVRTGERVGRKQPVGLSGDTGRVTGPHLHYILRIEGKAVDPEAYGEAPRRHRATDEVTVPTNGVGLEGEEGATEGTPPKKPPPQRPKRPKPAAKADGKKPGKEPGKKGAKPAQDDDTKPAEPEAPSSDDDEGTAGTPPPDPTPEPEEGAAEPVSDDAPPAAPPATPPAEPAADAAAPPAAGPPAAAPAKEPSSSPTSPSGGDGSPTP